jgi:hypothetical protein
MGPAEMKMIGTISSGVVFALVLTVGQLAVVATHGSAQASVHSENWLPESRSAAYQPAEEAVRLQETMNQFDSALATHDVRKLEAAGVQQVSVKRWQRFFKDNPRATVTDRCPASELLISNDAASWTCTETSTIISDGRPRSYVHVIRFIFAKTSGGWMVADRR